MKKILIFIILISISFTTYSQNDSYSKFYKTYKNNDDVINFRLPASFIAMFVDKDDEPELKHILQELDNLRFFISESKDLLPELLKSVSNKNYNDLIVIKDSSASTITFKAREEDKSIKEIVMMIEEENSFVVMSFDGEFTEKDIKKLIKYIDKDKVKKAK